MNKDLLKALGLAAFAGVFLVWAGVRLAQAGEPGRDGSALLGVGFVLLGLAVGVWLKGRDGDDE